MRCVACGGDGADVPFSACHAEHLEEIGRLEAEMERLMLQLCQVKRPLIPTADDLLRMYDERHK